MITMGQSAASALLFSEERRGIDRNNNGKLQGVLDLGL